jgi:hypothetical protein
MILNKKLNVINFWGGPGVGKSTSAAGLFFAMKVQRFSVELVTEYAKDCVWEERWKLFPEQDYFLAKQNRRLKRLVGKVEYAISDSPLALSVSYVGDDFPESFKTFCLDQFNSYTNLNIFLRRTAKYEPRGRRQSEESADAKSRQVKKVMDEHKVEYIELDADDAIVDNTLQIVKNMQMLKLASPVITLEK